MRELFCALAVACIACGGQATPNEGRGSSACRDWQDSVCDWAERCQALDRDACDEQFQAVTCKSDKSASMCADKFDRASCGGVASCDLDDIADPAPAAKACDALMDRFCERVVECGVTSTQADCVTSVMEDVDCSRSVAYTLGYESCLERIDDTQCDVVLLPAICDNVIISRHD